MGHERFYTHQHCPSPPLISILSFFFFCFFFYVFFIYTGNFVQSSSGCSFFFVFFVISRYRSLALPLLDTLNNPRCPAIAMMKHFEVFTLARIVTIVLIRRRHVGWIHPKTFKRSYSPAQKILRVTHTTPNDSPTGTTKNDLTC
jgi:hypothetical protein